MGMDIRGLNPRIKLDDDNFDYDLCARAGTYFRANVWSWRPLRILCEWLNDNSELRLDMTGWEYNSGHGLKTQYECDSLADALEHLDIYYPCRWDENPFENDPFFDEFLLYVDTEGILQVARIGEDMDLSGVQYSTVGSHYRQWVTFLWNCGGFAIY
jgi:hypothetical protein